MFVRIPLAALLGSVIVFGMFIVGWGFWNVLPMQFHPIKPFPSDLVQDFAKAFERDGQYVYPAMPEHTGDEAKDKAAKELFEKQYAEGPYLQATVKVTTKPEMHLMMVLGWANYYFAAFVAALILAMAGSHWYVGRVILVMLLGTFVALSTNTADAIWWHEPLDFALFRAAYSIASWTAAGLVMAMIIRPRHRTAK